MNEDSKGVVFLHLNPYKYHSYQVIHSLSVADTRALQAERQQYIKKWIFAGFLINSDFRDVGLC